MMCKKRAEMLVERNQCRGPRESFQIIFRICIALIICESLAVVRGQYFSRYIRPSPMNFKSSKKLKYELCILSIYSMRTTTFRVPNNEMITTALVHGSRRMSDGLLPGLILYYYSTTAPFSFERGAQKARGRQYNKEAIH